MISESCGPPDTAGPVVSIVLATVNERASIAPLLTELLGLDLPPIEIIVVDDGSVDGTREFLQEFGRRDHRVHLLCHDGRQTLTTAQLQGIRAASGQYIIIMDADLQHPPETVPELVRALSSGQTLAIASRYLSTGDVGRRTPYRAVISRGAELIAKLTLTSARKVSDPISGFFGFHRGLSNPLDSSTRGYKLLLLLLVISEGNGVMEVGYRFRSRIGGSSKITHDFSFIKTFVTEVLMAKQLELWRNPKHHRHETAPAPSGSAIALTPVPPPGESKATFSPGSPPS